MGYLFIDLEMTGTEYGYHDIIQIGAVLTDINYNEISQFSTLVYPQNEDVFSQESENIHGISIFDLEEAPMIYDSIELLENWIRKSLHFRQGDSLKNIVLCGQSIMNDINFLMASYKEQHLSWPFSYRILDLMTLTDVVYRLLDKKNIERPKSYSLRSASKFLKIHIENEKHDALEDAQLTLKCFKRYNEILDEMLIKK